MGVSESVIVSDFEQGRLGVASQIDGVLVRDHVIEFAMEDDRIGFDMFGRSPFFPSWAEQNEFCISGAKVHGQGASARATDDDFGSMFIEELLSRRECDLKVLVIEFWVQDLESVLGKISWLDATWDAVPTVEEEDFHGLVIGVLRGLQKDHAGRGSLGVRLRGK